MSDGAGGDRAGVRPPGDRSDDADGPVLPEVSQDERAVGWGDDTDGARGDQRDAEWYRRERPPHWE